MALSWVRAVLLVCVLGLLAYGTPTPWGGLWLLVPAAVAVSLLVAWRFGLRGMLVPVALFAAAPAAGGVQLWAWWVPVAALTGAWMGLREEGAGPAPGDRAWMLLPVLLLAAGLPWTLLYPHLIQDAEGIVRGWGTQQLEVARQMHYPPDQLKGVEELLQTLTAWTVRSLPDTLPTVLFVWVALLVAAGRSLSARVSASLKWPGLSRSRLSAWRLPDGALWLLLGGLALLLVGWPTWKPTAWTLVINTALGFGVQGIAVVESLLLARGVPPSVIVVSLAFVFLVAWPVFVLTAVGLGLSDVWLDFRRLEPTPHADER